MRNYLTDAEADAAINPEPQWMLGLDDGPWVQIGQPDLSNTTAARTDLYEWRRADGTLLRSGAMNAVMGPPNPVLRWDGTQVTPPYVLNVSEGGGVWRTVATVTAELGKPGTIRVEWIPR